jgi:phage tail-like protein
MRGTVAELVSPRPMGPAMPALYQEDPFAQGFLSALDTVLAPVMGTLDNLDAYLDPYLTPDDFLVWLATWVGMTVDDTWTIERRREAVARAVELYRLRGTATGLQQQVEIHTGGAVEIIENGGTAWSIDPGGELPGSPKPLVVVRVQVDDPKALDASRVEALVAAAKPAHVEHRVEILKPGGKKGSAKADAATPDAEATGDGEGDSGTPSA